MLQALILAYRHHVHASTCHHYYCYGMRVYYNWCRHSQYPSCVIAHPLEVIFDKQYEWVLPLCNRDSNMYSTWLNQWAYSGMSSLYTECALAFLVPACQVCLELIFTARHMPLEVTMALFFWSYHAIRRKVWAIQESLWPSHPTVASLRKEVTYLEIKMWHFEEGGNLPLN